MFHHTCAKNSNFEFLTNYMSYIKLWRFCTARESDTGFSRISPTKVKACKNFLLTEKIPCIENKDHLVDFVIIHNMLLLLLYVDRIHRHQFCFL